MYGRELVDSEAKRHAVHVVDSDGPVVVEPDGGFVRVSRRLTNLSKLRGCRALETLCGRSS